MTSSNPGPAGSPLPKWCILAGSLLIVFHLGSLLVHGLAAPSGPWPSREGPDFAAPPQLALLVDEPIAQRYLPRIKLTHNYHFPSNRPGTPGAFLEVRLKDKEGEVVKTVRFPDPKASWSVRQRQALATRWLTDDQMAIPPQGERIPAPGEKIPEVPVWTPASDEGGEQSRKLNLSWMPENELPRPPRDQPLARPTDWSLLVVRSLARHLCRVHGANSAEVVRRSRDPLPPRILFEREAPPPMEDLESNYGRLSR
jgi:hypothetical protein